jgi:hypothetical protein
MELVLDSIQRRGLVLALPPSASILGKIHEGKLAKDF